MVVVLLLGVLVPAAGPLVQNLAQGLQGLPALLGSFPGGPLRGGPLPGGTLSQSLPSGELVQVEVWLTKEDRPDAERFTTFTTQDEVFIWVKGPEGRSDQFRLALTFAGTTREPIGPAFALDPSGAPVQCGSINHEHNPPPSPVLLEVLIGDTPVASLQFSFEAGDASPQ